MYTHSDAIVYGCLLTALIVLLLTIVALVAWAILHARYTFRRAMHARTTGRSRKAVSRIHTEDWKGSSIEAAVFERLWTSAAEALRIDAELMRPQDKVEDLIINSEWFWPDASCDIAEYFLDLIPDCDPFGMADRTYDTVGDLVETAIQEMCQRSLD